MRDRLSCYKEKFSEIKKRTTHISTYFYFILSPTHDCTLYYDRVRCVYSVLLCVGSEYTHLQSCRGCSLLFSLVNNNFLLIDCRGAGF